MEGKGGGTRGRDRDRVFQCHKIIFIENNPMFSPVGTHTQTPPQPSVLSLGISINETSLLVVSWQAERVGWGVKVCEEATASEEVE